MKLSFIVKRNAVIGLLFVFFTILAIFAFYTAFTHIDRVFPNVYVDNIDIGGKTKDEAYTILSKNNPLESKITVVMGTDVLKEFKNNTNSLFVDYHSAIEKSYQIGRGNNIVTNVVDTVNSTFKIKKLQLDSELQYDRSELQEFMNFVNDKYNVEPKDAIFEYNNNRVSRIEKESYGKYFDMKKFIADYEEAVRNLRYSSKNVTLEISFQDAKPNKILSEINEFGIEDLIGEGQSNYSGSGENRVFNLKLAASKFNGVIIPEGGTISFGEIVGDISASSGYKEGYIISGGKTMLEAGGGVCQTSTTLFRAALNTGLEIKEWYSHAYRVKYYENDSLPGMDATIYLPYVDLKIGNNTKGAMLIMVEYEEHNNVLRMKFYGQKDDRKVELSPIQIYDEVAAPAPKYIYDSSIATGEVRQIDWAASGAKTKFTYKVNIGGKQVINRDFVSEFQPWQAVFLVGTL